MSWHDLVEADGLPVRESPLESARFGLSFERVTVSAASDAPLSAVLTAVRRSEADIVVLRYPARHVEWFAALTALGRTAVLADSLVYWRLDAGKGRGPEPSPGLWAAGVTDPAVVREAVSAVFGSYGNHYLANPLLDAGAALEGYRDWALRSAAGGGCLGLYGEAPDGPGSRLLGLATVEEDDTRTEILLAGTVPGARGRGLYAHLLKGVEERALARGAAEVVISTQGHNTGVQRAWARYGFEPVCTALTVHLVRCRLPRAPER
ncbi:GNAT family N-acetyltransferase [Streptosporangium sp. NPDC048047]|uniref:GNAT family N-acetyltransferase n=1 Tax=Streptosporangium sp. NPDC048047 TaxID=3155748 RepID=UPI00343DE0E9